MPGSVSVSTDSIHGFLGRRPDPAQYTTEGRKSNDGHVDVSLPAPRGTFGRWSRLGVGFLPKCEKLIH